MEGFSLECKLFGTSSGGSWPFDPVSGDALLMPHARTKSIISEHEAAEAAIIPSSLYNNNPSSHILQDKFNSSSDYPSLTLTSLTSLNSLTSLTSQAPFTLLTNLNSLSSLQNLNTLNGLNGSLNSLNGTDDLNNNSHSSNNNNNITNNNNNNNDDIPLLTSNSSFLTLDPLVGHHVVNSDDPDDIKFFSSVTGESNSNAIIVNFKNEDDNAQEEEGSLRLPKFEDIHILRKEDDLISHHHQQQQDTSQAHHTNHDPNAHFDFDPEEPCQQNGSPCNDSSTSGGGASLYFSIHDLTTSYSSATSAPTTSTSSFHDIQNDEDDNEAEPFLEDLGNFEEGHTLLEAVDPDDPDDLEDDDEVFEARVQCTKLEEVEEDDEEEIDENCGGKQAELKCKFCGFVCCSKSSLGIHERRHTGERPYSCKHCGRLFNSAQCCKHHERLHTGDKPFECQYCGKKYAVSTRLKRHERVHTREEPYKCIEPGCGKTFRWFDAFRDHRNTHNGVPLYLCSVCGKSFTSYLKFYYHERGHFLKRERERDKILKLNQPGALKSEAKTKSPKTPKGPRKPRAKKNI